MLPTEFLATVVPPGNVVVARMVDATGVDGRTFKTFSHAICKSHEQAVKTAELWSSQGSNAYFALASYKQGFHLNDKGKRVLRVASNVASLKALWLDIDFKGIGGLAEAAEALTGFCEAVSLPPPAIVVGSGNGLHVYWPLTTPLPLERWQRLADALKEACRQHDFKVDPAVTADSARVLRVPGTLNHKDPANPKPVEILYSSGELFDPAQLEGILVGFVPSSLAPFVAANSDLTGGLAGTKAFAPVKFADIIPLCSVADHILDTSGKDCIEPEWVAMLQLLKHCEDGETFVHEVSKGHPGYSPGDTDRKWEARKSNTVGPTLCSTFEDYYPSLCAKCPLKGQIKTPLSAPGHVVKVIEIDHGKMPGSWRIAKDAQGNPSFTERLFVSDPTTGAKEWMRVIPYAITSLRASVTADTKEYGVSFTAQIGTRILTVSLPSHMLGSMTELSKRVANFGVALHPKELESLRDLMNSWIRRLQIAKDNVMNATGKLGWIIEHGQIAGFTHGTTNYFSDGRVERNVPPPREFLQLSTVYEPKGSLDVWKDVAGFIAKQDNPALTAVLAASFGAPLYMFTGMQGGILSLVSSLSGVGKSSALKAAQAVWGDPHNGINAVDDTEKSMANKCGYLNNLPGFWDELRGRETVDGFAPLAFRITQGRERSRLNQNAEQRRSGSWHTMLIVASNESIFEAMGRASKGSDAGMVRVLEMYIDKFPDDTARGDLMLMFGKLQNNYGHAGGVYAKYLAENHGEVAHMVAETFTRFSSQSQDPSERFWYGVMTCMLVGASIADRLDLVHINVDTLRAYLMDTIKKMRGRTKSVRESQAPEQLLSEFYRTYGNSILVVDRCPTGRQSTASYKPVTILDPRSGKCLLHEFSEDKILRFPVSLFEKWLRDNDIPLNATIRRLKEEMGATMRKLQLGIGTKYQQPRANCLEIQLPAPLGSAISDCSESPDDNPDLLDD